MARLVRYTLHALKRGTHRRGDVLTVPEGSDFDRGHKADKAWTRTLMPAHIPTRGPAPDQGVQTAYRALLTFLREAAARASSFDAAQREAYALLLLANKRELGEHLKVVFSAPSEFVDDDTEDTEDEARARAIAEREARKQAERDAPPPAKRPEQPAAPPKSKGKSKAPAREREHHPSFTDEERRRFFAVLGELCADEEMDKDTVYALAETVRERLRPSAMSTEQRDDYLAWLSTPEGRTAYATFAGEPLSESPPPGEATSPLTPPTPADLGDD